MNSRIFHKNEMNLLWSHIGLWYDLIYVGNAQKSIIQQCCKSGRNFLWCCWTGSYHSPLLEDDLPSNHITILVLGKYFAFESNFTNIFFIICTLFLFTLYFSHFLYVFFCSFSFFRLFFVLCFCYLDFLLTLFFHFF